MLFRSYERLFDSQRQLEEYGNAELGKEDYNGEEETKCNSDHGTADLVC